ncbi:MAG TPA: hypothetical protein PKG54_19830 [Phycisphaerae bacterium]|nr:hypothetical protein [Phycisphaerae bacterium]
MRSPTSATSTGLQPPSAGTPLGSGVAEVPALPKQIRKRRIVRWIVWPSRRVMSF